MTERIEQKTQHKNFLTSGHLVFFYDGYCNLCSNFTQFIKERDLLGLINYAPLQSSFVKQFLIEHNLDATRINTIVCSVDGEVYIKSTAVIKILQQLPIPWPAIALFLLVPEVIRDSFYDLVSSNRYEWFGQRKECF